MSTGHGGTMSDGQKRRFTNGAERTKKRKEASKVSPRNRRRALGQGSFWRVPAGPLRVVRARGQIKESILRRTAERGEKKKERKKKVAGQESTRTQRDNTRQTDLTKGGSPICRLIREDRGGPIEKQRPTAYYIL